MGWPNPNLYHQPEAFGFTLVDEMDFADSYEFDIVALLKGEAGFFTIEDSGCSCPSPFEEHCDTSYLDAVFTTGELREALRDKARGSWGNVGTIMDGIEKFIDTARAAGLPDRLVLAA